VIATPAVISHTCSLPNTVWWLVLGADVSGVT
jgi:hypothetical protein